LLPAFENDPYAHSKIRLIVSEAGFFYYCRFYRMINGEPDRYFLIKIWVVAAIFKPILRILLEIFKGHKLGLEQKGD